MPREPFTFACPIWKNPWMWCGGDTYVSRLVECAGGRNVLGDRTRYPQLDLESVLAMQPDVIFLPDEPYRLHRSRRAGDRRRARSVRSPATSSRGTAHGRFWGLRFLEEVLVPRLRKRQQEKGVTQGG